MRSGTASVSRELSSDIRHLLEYFKPPGYTFDLLNCVCSGGRFSYSEGSCWSCTISSSDCTEKFGGWDSLVEDSEKFMAVEAFVQPILTSAAKEKHVCVGLRVRVLSPVELFVRVMGMHSSHEVGWGTN
jgi:hypothetical protein